MHNGSNDDARCCLTPTFLCTELNANGEARSSQPSWKGDGGQTQGALQQRRAAVELKCILKSCACLHEGLHIVNGPVLHPMTSSIPVAVPRYNLVMLNYDSITVLIGSEDCIWASSMTCQEHHEQLRL